VEKDKESLRLELSNAKGNIGAAEAALGSQKAQLEKLNHVVAEADAGVVCARACVCVRGPVGVCAWHPHAGNCAWPNCGGVA
jgi:hypothetical protein